MLGTINKEIEIVNDFSKCVFGRHQVKRSKQLRQPESIAGRNARNAHFRHNDSNNQYNSAIHVLCYKCGESNHETNDCKHKKQLKCFHCGFLGHKSGRCVQTA